MRATSAAAVLAVAGFLSVGCVYQDPRVPLDTARRDINDIRAFQLQALALRGLQDDLQEVFAKDSHVTKADVGLHFTSADGGLSGQRLVVNCVILLTLMPGAFEPAKPPPSTEPAQEPSAEEQRAAEDFRDKCVQDLVREVLARHGWEVEDVNTYHYQREWRIVCQIRAAAAPPWAGAGLDILPKRGNWETRDGP